MSNNFMDNANATSVVTAIGNKIKARDKTFYGTEEQWAALSTAQKKEYDFKATPDGGVTLNGVQAKIEKNVLWIEGHPVIGFGNTEMYINPQTGVDDYAGGYGYSAAKPFASIDYAQKYIPRLSIEDANGKETKITIIHLSGTFTSETIKEYTFEYPDTRLYLMIDSDTVFNNCILRFLHCSTVILRINANLTFNITDTTISSTTRVFTVAQSTLIIDSSNATAQNNHILRINGNSTKKSNIRGIEVGGGSKFHSGSSFIRIENNQCDIAFAAYNVSMAFFMATQGSDNNTVFFASAAILMFGNNSATGTTVQKTAYGGRIYTGQQ